MLDSLLWKPLPDDLALELLAKLVEAEKPAMLSDYQVRGSVAPLPPYPTMLLVHLVARHRAQPQSQSELYALWSKDFLRVLNGESGAVHDANSHEKLELNAESAVPYVRFFCFAVRGPQGGFILLEPAKKEGDPPRGEAAPHAKPITPAGTDATNQFLYDVVVAYNNSIFSAKIAVAPSGLIEMLDDVPLAAEVPAGDLPVLPELGTGSGLQVHLAAIKAGIAAAPVRPSTLQPPLHTLVELLLERALQKQSSHRLIETFRASLKPIPPLDEFAALVIEACPVVCVESSLPFVEESIGEILMERRKPQGRYTVVTAEPLGDDTEIAVRVQTDGPGMVLVPLQVYRRVSNVDRLAYQLATRDLSAIISCEQAAALPESLRRLTDIVLTLPNVDTQIFEQLFERVIGQKPPAQWADDGNEWVKHINYTDFEHPRRMKLPHDEAFQYVRAQVRERLGAVNVSEALGLNELHGLGEARQFAADLITDIHAAMKGQIPWSQVDRGALLVGAPGTGKTTLARAIARDCGIRFITASATGWQAVGQHLGHHISAIRKTFAEARQYAPTILFIDEIDSIGNRETFSGQGAQYATEVVNALLEQLQGIDPAAPVFVIGATNHEDRVDPALRRSGRLDRIIRIPRPNAESLGLIYGHYLGKLSAEQGLAADIDSTALGRLSLGLTGADVERIVRGAARRARKESRKVGQFDVIAEITNKPRSKDGGVRLTPADIERTAVHEAGHAVALYLSSSKGADIGFISVIPREDGTLGFVAPDADERVSLTRRDYQEKIEVLLAGRASEEVRYGAEQVSDGASSDLLKASRLALAMVTRLGLGRNRKLLWSESPSGEDVSQANDLLADALERILERLRGQRVRLDELANALIARQELSGDEVRALLMKQPA